MGVIGWEDRTMLRIDCFGNTDTTDTDSQVEKKVSIVKTEKTGRKD